MTVIATSHDDDPFAWAAELNTLTPPEGRSQWAVYATEDGIRVRTIVLFPDEMPETIDTAVGGLDIAEGL